MVVFLCTKVDCVKVSLRDHEKVCHYKLLQPPPSCVTPSQAFGLPPPPLPRRLTFRMGPYLHCQIVQGPTTSGKDSLEVVEMKFLDINEARVVSDLQREENEVGGIFDEFRS